MIPGHDPSPKHAKPALLISTVKVKNCKKTNYPVEGEEPSKILYTVPGAQLISLKSAQIKQLMVKGKLERAQEKMVIFKEKEKVVNLTMKKEKKEGRINLLSHHQVST